MEITTTYTTPLGSVFSEKPAGRYTKHVYHDGVLKIRQYRVEIKYKGEPGKRELKLTYYFLDESENKEAIIKQYCNVLPMARCIIYCNRQAAGLYSLWDCEAYSKEGILNRKGKATLDGSMKTIASINYLLGTFKIISAYKYVYLGQHENEMEDMRFEFNYKGNTGALIHINNYVNNNFEYIRTIYIDQFLADPAIQAQFPWGEHPYYHNLFPLLPEGPDSRP